MRFIFIAGSILFLFVLFFSISFSNEELDSDISFNPYGEVYNVINSNDSSMFRIAIVGDSVVWSGCPSAEIIERKLNQDIKSLKINDRVVSSFNVVNAGRGREIGTLVNMADHLNKSVIIDKILVQTGWHDHWYSPSINPCVRAGCFSEIDTGRMLINLSNSENKFIKGVGSNLFAWWSKSEYTTCLQLSQENPELFFEGLDPFNYSIYRSDLEMFNASLEYLFSNYDASLIVPPNALVPGKVPEMMARGCLMLHPEFYEVHYVYQNVSVDVANNFGVDIIDLDQSFRQIPDFDEKFFSDPDFDPLHPNKDGRYLCTMEVYDHIIESLVSEANELKFNVGLLPHQEKLD